MLFQYEVYFDFVDKFPWKLLICGLLIVLTSMQVLWTVVMSGGYYRGAQNVWYKMFMQKEVSLIIKQHYRIEMNDLKQGNDEIERSKNFFKLSELKEMIQNSVTNYYEIYTKTKELLDEYTPL